MDDMSSEKLLQQIYYFTNLINRERYRPNAKVNETKVNPAQAHLLGLLVVQDGLTQKELSTKLQIRPASLGELVDKLQQTGFVERRVNIKDKRITNVYLTEEGRKSVKEVMQARQELVDSIFSDLSEEEKNQLSNLMSKLIDSIVPNSDDNDLASWNHHRSGYENFPGESN
jgi:DNA-binding MarR family transcriptional regulator